MPKDRPLLFKIGFVSLLALFTLLLSACGSESSDQEVRSVPTPSPTPDGGGTGIITFSSNRPDLSFKPGTRDDNYDVFLMNTEGVILQQITDMLSENDVDFMDAVWSPDLNQVALSGTAFQTELYLLGNIPFFTMTPLTGVSGWDDDPDWSPDGSQLVFRSDRDGNFEVYVMDADGSNLTRLTDNAADESNPVWSPDGTRIAFATTRDGTSEIYVMDTDGSNPIRLTNNESNDYDPMWSPDGTRIAFATNRDGNFEIYVMDADGSNPIRLTNNESNDYSPAWSPDGTMLVYACREGVEEQQPVPSRICRMNADGTDVRWLTQPTGERGYAVVNDFSPIWR